DAHLRDVAGRTHELDKPAQDEPVDVDLFCRPPDVEQLVGREHLAEHLERMRVALLFDDLNLDIKGWIAERRLDGESVELRLREREGSLLLDGILRREDEEWFLEPVRDA